MTATRADEWRRRTEPGSETEPRVARTNLVELLRNGVPTPQFVDRHALLPEAARVWAVGPAESGKSIYGAHEAADLTRVRLEVAVFSEENPLSEDVRRFGRLRPDFDRLRFYHGQAIDLADAACVMELLRETFGCSVVIFDTLSACWSGDENDNHAIGELDREALGPFTREGATVLVLDHSGHPVPFTRRKASTLPEVPAPRVRRPTPCSSSSRRVRARFGSSPGRCASVATAPHSSSAP